MDTPRPDDYIAVLSGHNGGIGVTSEVDDLS